MLHNPQANRKHSQLKQVAGQHLMIWCLRNLPLSAFVVGCCWICDMSPTPSNLLMPLFLARSILQSVYRLALGHFDFSHSLGIGKGYFEQGSIPFCCTKFIPARYHQTQESRSWNRSYEEQLVRWVWTSLRNTEFLAAILCLLRVIMRILSTKTSHNYHSRSCRVEAPNNSENCWRVQKGDEQAQMRHTARY